MIAYEKKGSLLQGGEKKKKGTKKCNPVPPSRGAAHGGKKAKFSGAREKESTRVLAQRGGRGEGVPAHKEDVLGKRRETLTADARKLVGGGEASFCRGRSRKHLLCIRGGKNAALGVG